MNNVFLLHILSQIITKDFGGLQNSQQLDQNGVVIQPLGERGFLDAQTMIEGRSGSNDGMDYWFAPLVDMNPGKVFNVVQSVKENGVEILRIESTIETFEFGGMATSYKVNDDGTKDFLGRRGFHNAKAMWEGDSLLAGDGNDYWFAPLVNQNPGHTYQVDITVHEVV